VEALWDREAARRVIFRNLLQRQGYTSLDEVRAEGAAQGRAIGEAQGEIQGLRRAIAKLLAGRGLAVDDALRASLAGCSDTSRLVAALLQAPTASASDIVVTLRG
jgi:hypothetical protein